MSDAADRLRIKYGLTNNPSNVKINQWAQEVQRLRLQGIESEKAGHQAAVLVFADYYTMVYASEGDTLQTLLQLVQEK